MTIAVTCSCGKQLKTKDENAGKRARCPVCGQALIVPQPSAVDEDAEAFRMLMEEVPAPNPGPVTQEPAPPPLPQDAYGIRTDPVDEPPAPPPIKKKTKKLTPAAEHVLVSTTSGRSLRSLSYWFLLLALIPLSLSLFQKDNEDVAERIARSIRKIDPERLRGIDPESAGEEQFFDLLPDNRFDGAFLPRKTWTHWLFALISAGAFFGVILLVFPMGTANPRDLLLVGLFTATAGILLLLAVQYIAMFAQNFNLYGHSIVVVVFWVLKFIGFSYRCATDPDYNFIVSFFGFTCGVGLCEEICKVIPLLVHFRRSHGMGWQSACMWGLASGVGFGVSEGITYSSDFYNGIQSGGIYVVRFVSCVALHAIWSAAVAITIYKNQAYIQGDWEWGPMILGTLRMIAVPMVLHGLYDTCLKKDMNAPALIVAVASFGWLVWQIEWTRGHEAAFAPEG